MKKEKIVLLIIFLLGIILVAVAGSLFSNMGMAWFEELQKPTEWVPSITFAIVWAFVYVLFAIYTFFAIRNDWLDNDSVVLLIINGVLNVLWCFVFFSLQSLLGGLIVILLNLVAGYMLFAHLWKKSRTFGFVLTVYPLWLSLATCLNLAVWILN